MAKQECDILWIGRFDNYSGYRTVSESYLRAFDAVGISYVCLDIESGKIVGPSRGVNYSFNPLYSCYEFKTVKVAVICDIPKRFTRFKIVGVPVVGCTIFETDSVPAAWLNYFEDVDRIWVPTNFNVQTFSKAGIDSSKIGKISYSADPFYSNFKPKKPDIFSKCIRLLYICSNFNRKDISLIISAYLQVVKSYRNIELVIKTNSNTSKIDDILQTGLGAKKDDLQNKGVRIINGKYSKNRLRELYQSTDLYVTTERAKGWDFPAFDAMCMGIPTVTLDGSAVDFVNSSNGYLVKTRDKIHIEDFLVENEEIYKLHYWEDIFVDDFADTLLGAIKDVITDRILKRKNQCKQDSTEYSPGIIGNEIRCEIEALINKNKQERIVKVYL